jgi:hypothetical protein
MHVIAHVMEFSHIERIEKMKVLYTFIFAS